MRPFTTVISLLVVIPAGCGHFAPWRGGDDCSTPCQPAATTAAVTAAAPRVEVTAAPPVQVRIPAPQVTILESGPTCTAPAAPVVQPFAQPVAPAYAQPYAQPGQAVLFVQPPRQRLALKVDWFDLSLPLPSLGTVAEASPPQPVFLPQPAPVPAAPPAVPQFVPVFVQGAAPLQPAAPPRLMPAADPGGSDRCRELEGLRAAIEALQRASGCR